MKTFASKATAGAIAAPVQDSKINQGSEENKLDLLQRLHDTAVRIRQEESQLRSLGFSDRSQRLLRILDSMVVEQMDALQGGGTK